MKKLLLSTVILMAGCDEQKKIESLYADKECPQIQELAQQNGDKFCQSLAEFFVFKTTTDYESKIQQAEERTNIFLTNLEALSIAAKQKNCPLFPYESATCSLSGLSPNVE